MKYTGTYQDKFGTEEIIVNNDYDRISFAFGDFKFVGSCLDDFELDNHRDYKIKELKRFTFRTIDVYQSDEQAYELIDFTLSFLVPTSIVNATTQDKFPTELSIKVDVKADDNDTRITLKINHNNNNFEGVCTEFEGAANQLNRQIDGEFVIKNCFWCIYSDYSVYGQSLLGSMHCFVKNKDNYLNVKTKRDYMDLSDDFSVVQEIYDCDSFEPRRSGTGYRG